MDAGGGMGREPRTGDRAAAQLVLGATPSDAPAAIAPDVDARLRTLLIPAVGGQGGGVLAEWIVEAAQLDGLVAHGTSIPGVAQRTGSTTYYVEVFVGDASDAPTFSLYPVPGALDVLLAPEFLEVGRAIELGFPSPARTTIVASTHRLYSIHEKITTRGDVYPADELAAAARAMSRTLIAFDALQVAREHGTEVNAVLLGALAASEAMPIRAQAFRDAITRKGVGVEANLRGFDVGRALGGQAAGAAAGAPRPDAKRAFRAPPVLVDAVQALPAPLRPAVGEAIARLVDYQDARYARLYLERLTPFASVDVELARTVAKHLAVWMTYEDAIRVADLKTRRSRFERIRADAGAADAEIVVTDYLRPDLDELYGILPDRLVAPFARWAERRWPQGRPTPAQHVRTTTIAGFLRLWLLARARRLRPTSYRARREHERMVRWLDAVARCAGWSVELAREVAQAAQLVKGYGSVRRRLMAVLDRLVAAVVAAAEREAPIGDFAVSRGLARAARLLALQGPEGESRAVALAARVVADVEGGRRDGALRALAAVD